MVQPTSLTSWVWREARLDVWDLRADTVDPFLFALKCAFVITKRPQELASFLTRSFLLWYLWPAGLFWSIHHAESLRGRFHSLLLKVEEEASSGIPIVGGKESEAFQALVKAGSMVFSRVFCDEGTRKAISKHLYRGIVTGTRPPYTCVWTDRHHLLPWDLLYLGKDVPQREDAARYFWGMGCSFLVDMAPEEGRATQRIAFCLTSLRPIGRQAPPAGAFSPAAGLSCLSPRHTAASYSRRIAASLAATVPTSYWATNSRP